jgi:hypothetical protein
MPFDQQAPPMLKNLQEWFAGVITQPIDSNSRINPTAPSGKTTASEAAMFIVPSPTLTPIQRIEIYNQQYWWRLLSSLHEIFPLVTRLFGYSDFNMQIGIPYLSACPPNQWSLNAIGSRMIEWIDTYYLADDKPLVRDAVLLDWNFNHLFTAAQMPPLHADTKASSDAFTALLAVKLYLQPSVALLQFDSDLLTFRKELLAEEPDFWFENPFPNLERKKLHIALYRSRHQHITYDELSAVEYCLLQHFQSGSSIEECCDWLEKQEDAIAEEASIGLQQWIHGWIAKKWLTAQLPQSPHCAFSRS